VINNRPWLSPLATVLGIALAAAWYYRVELWTWWNTSDVNVNCTVGREAIACSVEQRGGISPAHVCWDVVATCANGTRPTAKACVDVLPNGTVSRDIAEREFTPAIGQCDEMQSIAAANFAASQLQ